MPHLRFNDVTKSFGATRVLREFNTTVDDGEFLVLLGPSGCGKSTLLRMIAGLTPVSSGTIEFDGTSVNSLGRPAQECGLRIPVVRPLPPDDSPAEHCVSSPYGSYERMATLPTRQFDLSLSIDETPALATKIEEISEQLGLGPLLNRRPAMLSGGQRQRVALARALVREPSLYLLDEPLSNLDAKLRTQMRGDITTLHRAVGKTFVYVTHDQVEAMTMATRIVVMDHGEVQQVGTPDEIYDRPANTFVATFVGSPPMNMIAGDLLQAYPKSLTGDNIKQDETSTDAIIGVRPENIRVEPGDGLGLPATIELVERIGAETLAGCRIRAAAHGPTDDEAALIFARVSSKAGYQPGVECSLAFDASSVSWFDRTTGSRREPPASVQPSQLVRQ